jgi:aldehyde dehydrogenase (NAD+)
VIVCADADLDLAARRIVWGKFYNAGQTCVAPDYLCVQSSVADSLLQKLRAQIAQQFGPEPKRSESLARIVNAKNCQRLAALVDPKKIFCGGEIDLEQKYIAPTILSGVDWSDAVMREEIFGPILPVLEFETPLELFAILSEKPKPLSAYLFSSSRETQNQFIERLAFGGGCANDVVVHLSNPHLPFGGVGESGMGRYHGEFSFQTFSHTKSLMHRSGFLDLAARYAPYTDSKLKFLRRLFRI